MLLAADKFLSLAWRESLLDSLMCCSTVTLSIRQGKCCWHVQHVACNSDRPEKFAEGLRTLMTVRVLALSMRAHLAHGLTSSQGCI